MPTKLLKIPILIFIIFFSQLHTAFDVTCCTCSILHLCAVSIDRSTSNLEKLKIFKNISLFNFFSFLDIMPLLRSLFSTRYWSVLDSIHFINLFKEPENVLENWRDDFVCMVYGDHHWIRLRVFWHLHH